MKRSHILVILFAALSLQAIADSQEPAYWMKKYPEASQEQTNRCMDRAIDAYNKTVSDTSWGNNGWAVLAKGTEWEACMEAKKQEK